MAELKFGSAGVTAKEIDLSGPVLREPVGVPAGIVGTSVRGPAFVPVTVGTIDDFTAKFGSTDGKKFGPIAVQEWMRNAGAVTYLKVLGVGDGKQRLTDTEYAGSVASAGFVVGEQEPDHSSDGNLADNPYANSHAPMGRLYFLGCFMSESVGSWVLSDPGLQTSATAVPVIRGVLMAASGVLLRLSSSYDGPNNGAPPSSLVGTDANAYGSYNGSVVLMDGGVAKQEIVLLQNGHKGTDPLYPNVVTASFDMTAPNYFANVLNTDPLKLQQAGHYLYASWDVHPSTAVVTGTNVVAFTSGAGAGGNGAPGHEADAFLVTGSQGRDHGTATAPNYENFEDRFGSARTTWFVSQKFGGKRTNLFRLHSIDSGEGPSTQYKVSIENIAPSGDPADKHGSFDVVVRSFTDRDSDQKPLEQWRGLSLDPSSDRYIAKVIGDLHPFFDFDRSETAQKLVIDGAYANNSNRIRVEVSSEVDQGTVDPEALPLGFRGAPHLVTSGSAPLAYSTGSQLNSNSVVTASTELPVPMRRNITAGSGAKQSVNPLLYWGVQFEHVTSLSTPNASTLFNRSLDSFARYFPNFMTNVQPVIVDDNDGVADTDANGVMDADRFNLNLFALDKVRVVTGSDGLADPDSWVSAVYVRDGNVTASDSSKTRAVKLDDFTQANRAYLKYTTFLQGGFDGVNLFDAEESTLSNLAVTEDMNATNRGRNNGPNVKTYAKALDIMKSTTFVDVQLLAIPGIRHPIITDAGIDACTERFDAMFVMDVEQYDNNGDLVTDDSQKPSVKLTVSNFADRALDSSMAAAYFPDVVVQDPTTQTNVVVPPSVVVLGALALNDAVGHPWFAPAGFTRGALPTTLEARVKLSKTNLDDLYDVDINPLVAFPGNASSGTNAKGGVIVWGQKTLQAAASALDRVNVRRLLIEIRRQVREIAQTIIFEPNRETTLAAFSSAVTPRLQRIQALAGLERFKVVIDSSTTTQQDVENSTIRGKIFVVPTKSLEFVSLSFVVTNNISQTS